VDECKPLVMGIDRDFVRAYAKAGRCRLTPSKPVLKAPVVSVFEATI